MAIILEGSEQPHGRVEAALVATHHPATGVLDRLAQLATRGIQLAGLFASAVEISRAVDRETPRRRRELGQAWMWTELGGSG